MKIRTIVFLQNEYLGILESILSYIEKEDEIVKVYAVGGIENDCLGGKHPICSMDSIFS